MNEILPRHVLCILGAWKTFDDVERILASVAPPEFTIDYDNSELAPDNRMVQAFKVAADTVYPSFTEHDNEGIERHSAVAYVLSPPIPQNASLQISGITLAIAAAFLEHGAFAVKNESSGVAHGAKRWLHLFSEFKAGYGTDNAPQFCNALYQAWVRRPLSDGEWWYTCGMHLLGQPDVEMEPHENALESVRCMDFLNNKLLEGESIQQLLQDKVLLKDDEEPRELRHMVCRRYESDDFFFNPFGYVRVTK